MGKINSQNDHQKPFLVASSWSAIFVYKYIWNRQVLVNVTFDKEMEFSSNPTT